MGDELGSVHAHQEIRNRGKLDAVEFFGEDSNIVESASIQQQRARTVERSVGNADIFLSRKIREEADRVGIEINAYTIGANLFQPTPEAQAAEIERLKGQVEVAAILGARTMRHDITWRTDVPWRQIIAETKDLVRELTEYAASKGVRTCTENHGFVMQDADRMEEMMLAVGHENYGWLVDMGNFLCADDPTVRAVAIAAPYAFHAHVKDFLVKPFDAVDPGDGWFKSRNGNYLRGTVAGHGVVPIAHALKVIKDSGYDGFVSYEFEGMEDNIPALEAAYAFISRVLPK